MIQDSTQCDGDPTRVVTHIANTVLILSRVYVSRVGNASPATGIFFQRCRHRDRVLGFCGRIPVRGRIEQALFFCGGRSVVLHASFQDFGATRKPKMLLKAAQRRRFANPGFSRSRYDPGRPSELPPMRIRPSRYPRGQVSGVWFPVRCSGAAFHRSFR